MTHAEIQTMFLGLAVLLAFARILGELARRFHQPTVVGEIAAGILLGPTVLGSLFPDFSTTLFPATGPVAIFRQGLETLGVALFLFTAGLEVQLSTMWRQGRTALSVGLLGLIVPFALGGAAAWWFPEAMGMHAGADPFVFAWFVATALAISALPVIARILLDLDLFRTDLGMVVVASAMAQDLVGWVSFAVILGFLGKGAHVSVAATAAFTLTFAVLMLTVGRWLFHRALLAIQAYLSWPAGVLGFVLSVALFSAAITEAFGLHAIFGTFLAGVAIGSSRHVRNRTRTTLEHFIATFFAPLFFGGIGLKVNFIRAFDPALVATVLAVATVGKLVGSGLGARWAGMSRRESWAVGFAMNARGAMEIILGFLALAAGLIDQRMFVALVVMALVTSIAGGPAMQWVLQRRRTVRFVDYLHPAAFVKRLDATDERLAIAALSRAAASALGLDAASVEKAALRREQLMPTGLPGAMAVPSARIPGLSRALVAVGLAESGIDFGAPDESAARLVFLVLSPDRDEGTQTELIADIGRTLNSAEMRERLVRVRNFTEFRALVQTGAG